MLNTDTDFNQANLPLISICIPTYNRAQKAFSLVTELLLYKGNEIEIVVLDNCSNDNTGILMSSISDPRILYIKNDADIGGPLNHLKVLTHAKGKYAFLCLDKDRLDYKRIPDLIEHISADNDVVFGYCVLNSYSEAPDLVYQQGYQSLMNMAYLSAHPSGMFYKTEILKNLEKLRVIFEERKKFPFYPDIINGEMAMTGKSKVINLPLFYTESKEDCSETPSFTYTNKDIFFMPSQRLLEYDTYMSSINDLSLTKIELFKLVKSTYIRCLLASTTGYRAILQDEKVCAHYGMPVRNVSLKEIINIEILVSSSFLKKKLPISYFSRLSIYFWGHIRILLQVIRS